VLYHSPSYISHRADIQYIDVQVLGLGSFQNNFVKSVIQWMLVDKVVIAKLKMSTTIMSKIGSL